MRTASLFQEGLIPAHTGKTMAHAFLVMVWSAHPRSRGEHGYMNVGIAENYGSSLLTRGIRRLICANISQLRQTMEAQLNAYH